jgi:hypothetical protein
VDKTTGLFFEQNLPFVNYGRVHAQCVNSLSIERKNKQQWLCMRLHYLEFLTYRAMAELRRDASTMYLGMLWWILEPVLYNKERLCVGL